MLSNVEDTESIEEAESVEVDINVEDVNSVIVEISDSVDALLDKGFIDALPVEELISALLDESSIEGIFEEGPIDALLDGKSMVVLIPIDVLVDSLDSVGDIGLLLKVNEELYISDEITGIEMDTNSPGLVNTIDDIGDTLENTEELTSSETEIEIIDVSTSSRELMVTATTEGVASEAVLMSIEWLVLDTKTISADEVATNDKEP